MSTRRNLLCLVVFLLGVGFATASGANGSASKIISIGGSVTEIVYALGQDHRLMARDTTSSHPPEANALPDVGYMRRLSPEGVLAFAPDLILAEEGSGPPEAVDILRKALVPFVEIPEEFSREGVVAKIVAVGAALGVEDRAAALAAEVDGALREAEARAAASVREPKRVLFILSTQGGRILASGRDTGADAIIRMAGGVNAVSEFDGYKPMSDEAVSVAAPDVILMMDRGDHSAANKDLFAMPAIATTPAAETEAVVRMNGLFLLGFGPRTAGAVTALTEALYTD